jgi:ABC-2 type transport system permease protein
MDIFEQLKRSVAVAKKDLLIYFLKGPTIIFGLLLPSFLFVAFAIGRDLSTAFLLPGLVGMTLFFTTSAVGPVIAPWETRMRTLERLVSTPIALWGIILGDIIASFAFGLFVTLVVLLVGVGVLGTHIMTISLLTGTILAAFCFSSLGLVLSSPPTNDPSRIMMLSTLVKFPLFLISGIFVPLAEMNTARLVSYISPLTYYVDLIRFSAQETNYFDPAVNILALLGFAVLLCGAAITLHQRNVTKRF